MDMNKTERFEIKVDPNNEMFIGPDECHYETKYEAIRSKLDLCGCGDPIGNHEFIISCLKARKELYSGTHILDHKKIEELVKENSGLVAELILHFLDQKGLTEHGTSVYGSWLTDAGKQFIEIGFGIKDDDN